MIFVVTQAINICKNLELLEDLVRCYSAQGSLYFRVGDTAKALARFDEALKIAERLEQKVRISFDILLSKADVSNIICLSAARCEIIHQLLLSRF